MLTDFMLILVTFGSDPNAANLTGIFGGCPPPIGVKLSRLRDRGHPGSGGAPTLGQLKLAFILRMEAGRPRTETNYYLSSY